MTNIDSYPRETDELAPVTVSIDGAAVTSGIEFALTTGNERPETWTEPYVVGDASGVRVADLEPGVWKVWAKVTDSPEIPVIECGYIRVT